MRIIDTTGRTVADGQRSSRILVRIGVQNVDGGHLEPGTEHDVPDWFAIEVVNSGRAVFAPEPRPATPPITPAIPAPTSPAVLEQRDPTPEHRDPQPPRRKR